MPKGTILVFSNPVSAEREQEFNDWYNKIHLRDALAVPGLVGASRYRLSKTQQPGAKLVNPNHRYLAIYDLDEVDTAVTSMAKALPGMQISDAIDIAGAEFTVYEHCFTYKK